MVEDLTLTTSDYKASRTLERQELGKNVVVGVRVLEGSPDNNNVLSVPHAQRQIKLPSGELIRKDWFRAPLRPRGVKEKEGGDTTSALLALEIYEASGKKPALVSSTLSQATRELNIIKRKEGKTKEELLADQAVNISLFDSDEVVWQKDQQSPVGITHFLRLFEIPIDFSQIKPQGIETIVSGINRAIRSLNSSYSNYKEIVANLGTMRSWLEYHQVVHNRLQRVVDNPTRKIALEVHTANPNKPGGVEVIVGTRYGLSSDLDLLVKYCQALKNGGLVVHDTLTELAFNDPERIAELEKTIPGVRQRVEAFKKYVQESGTDINSYHTSPQAQPEEKKKLQLAGTSVLDFRRQLDSKVSAIQIEVPRDIILQPQKRKLIAQASANFLAGLE